MFDTHIKQKIFIALKKAKVKNLPASWENSIYEQAAISSGAAKKIMGDFKKAFREGDRNFFFTLTLQKSRMLQIQGIVSYRESSTTQGM